MKKYFYLLLSIILLIIIILEIAVKNDFITVFASGDKKPIYSVETEEKKVAISFDAAWGADNTEKLMDICESYEVHATFFLVGFWVDKYPEMVKEIYSRGFEIGNHSENHPQMSKLSTEQMKYEIESVNNKIFELTGEKPQVFRPPYGDYSNEVVQTVNDLGMHCIQWSIDSLDWKEYGKEELVKRVLKNVKSGDIILCHNNAKYTPSALPEILESLQNKGFSVCSVGELIYNGDYSVDNQGIQHKIC